MRVSEPFIVLFVTVFVGAITDHGLMASSLPVLWAIWRFLRLDEGPPVLAFAMTYHWGQCVIGLYYYWLTGRRPLGMQADLYPEMVVISLVCIGLLIAGIR